MEYAINLTDGRIVAYNEQVARQTAYARVPADVAQAVSSGKIDWKAVAELVHKKRNNDPKFSWDAFDKLRDQQNIRKAKYDPVEPDKAAEPLPDSVPQVDLSMADFTQAPSSKGAVRARDNVSQEPPAPRLVLKGAPA